MSVATATFNQRSSSMSHENPYFLVFDKDQNNPLMNWLRPLLRHLGVSETLHHISVSEGIITYHTKKLGHKTVTGS